MKHFTLTLDATAQPLSQVLADQSVGGKNDVTCAVISLQPKGANGNVVRVGGPGVSANNFAFTLPAGAAGVPPAPLLIAPGIGPPRRLSEIYVLGTLNDILQIGILEF